ncbi:hypothetical protein CC1G_08019 [Coprinopsis cinerea okayama7|uniref:Uncharacterized protein n=1 Tax=Coprinopsis cinerea (strain Okayama-7 / 130 / ATCC MYA-4618 / FGSC 9003) TaxID=240176 RepID=A8NQA2_COPC7|nr:hypothetical protein CC1G_08019 [Coprinopsis cinerea okayama7\|eukprot:XP_001835510.1 hypothetical protein CC1G_08019 [Coprinopsis cinerea okayama7\
MPRQKKKQAEEEELADFDFLESQPSSSEDQQIERILAERIAAAKEKKRQERDQRFLDGASTSLNKILDEAEEEVQSTAEAIDKLFSQFVEEYAAIEDRIHHLWTEILKRHQFIEGLLQEKHKLSLELAKKCEDKHIHGLSKMKGACKQFEAAVQSLLEESEDEEDSDS